MRVEAVNFRNLLFIIIILNDLIHNMPTLHCCSEDSLLSTKIHTACHFSSSFFFLHILEPSLFGGKSGDDIFKVGFVDCATFFKFVDYFTVINSSIVLHALFHHRFISHVRLFHRRK